MLLGLTDHLGPQNRSVSILRLLKAGASERLRDDGVPAPPLWLCGLEVTELKDREPLQPPLPRPPQLHCCEMEWKR